MWPTFQVANLNSHPSTSAGTHFLSDRKGAIIRRAHTEHPGSPSRPRSVAGPKRVPSKYLWNSSDSVWCGAQGLKTLKLSADFVLMKSARSQSFGQVSGVGRGYRLTQLPWQIRASLELLHDQSSLQGQIPAAVAAKQ